MPNLVDGRELRRLIAHSEPWLYTVAFSFDGRTSGREPRTLDGGQTVAFSPDGRMLVSGSKDFKLKLWDVAMALLGFALAASRLKTGSDDLRQRGGAGGGRAAVGALVIEQVWKRRRRLRGG